MKKGIEKYEKESYSFLSNFVFFMNVFVALAVAGSASFLVGTEFGQYSLIFAFLILILSTWLKWTGKW